MMQRNLPPVARRGVWVSGSLALLMGAFCLAAWFCGWAAQWSAAGVITVKTNMALAQILAGAALLLLPGSGPGTARHRLGTVLGALVFLIGALTLSEHLFHY